MCGRSGSSGTRSRFPRPTRDSRCSRSTSPRTGPENRPENRPENQLKGQLEGQLEGQLPDHLEGLVGDGARGIGDGVGGFSVRVGQQQLPLGEVVVALLTGRVQFRELVGLARASW